MVTVLSVARMMFTVSDHHVAGDGDTEHASIKLLEHLQGVPHKMDTYFGPSILGLGSKVMNVSKYAMPWLSETLLTFFWL